MKRLGLCFAFLFLLSSVVEASSIEGTWRLPVPSGLTAGDVVIATNGHTLVNRTGIMTEGSYFLDPIHCRVASPPAGGAIQSRSSVAYDITLASGGAGDGWNRASRVASNVWAYARWVDTGMATETYIMRCNLDSPLQLYGGLRGIKITSLGIVWEVRTAKVVAGVNWGGLASHYWGKLATLGYAHNSVINQNADLATTPTMATATVAYQHLTTVTVTTPAYLPAAGNTALTAEWVLSIPQATEYRLYGVQVNFTRRDH